MWGLPGSQQLTKWEAERQAISDKQQAKETSATLCPSQAAVNVALPTALLTTSNTDETWMELALAEARAAQEAGEVPVGAVIVKDGELLATGQNRNLRNHDPSAHAEIVALRAAGERLGNHRLEDCEIYVIVEPCAMCSGALVHSRVKRLVYGAKDPKAGAVESVLQVVNHSRLNHRMEITGGVLEAQCSQMLRDFFRARRQES